MVLIIIKRGWHASIHLVGGGAEAHTCFQNLFIVKHILNGRVCMLAD